MLENHYFPLVVYEQMFNAHKFRINELILQPNAIAFVNQVMDYKELAASTMKFAHNQARKLHLEILGGTLLDSFKKNYAKMQF